MLSFYVLYTRIYIAIHSPMFEDIRKQIFGDLIKADCIGCHILRYPRIKSEREKERLYG